jgi:hypothetical protein
VSTTEVYPMLRISLACCMLALLFYRAKSEG